MEGRALGGRFIVITGPMFSGKTSRLLEFLEREQLANNSIMLFKPDIDNRYTDSAKGEAAANGIPNGHVYSHKMLHMPAELIPIGGVGGEMIRSKAEGIKAVGVDEAQFFTPEAKIPETLEQLANAGTHVYVSMLNKDHRGGVFGISADMLTRADMIYSLSAVCRKCGSDNATLTQKVINGKEVFGEQVEVGGKDLYEPRCRDCFVREK